MTFTHKRPSHRDASFSFAAVAGTDAASRTAKPPRHGRVWARGAVPVALALLLGGGVAHAASSPTGEQIDDAADRVDELNSDVRDGVARTKELDARLRQLDARLAGAAAQLADAETRASDAQREAELASVEVERTESDLTAARSELRENREQLDDAVRSAWIYGGTSVSPTMTALSSLASGADLDDAADAVHLLGIVVEGRNVLLEETRALVERTEQLQRTVATAQADASARADEAERAWQQAAAHNADVLALVEEADAAVREQRDQLAQLESERASADEALEQLEQAREDAITAAADVIESRPVADGLVSVDGITVAASLGPALEDLLEAAYQDGLILTGYGYRSPETTARLRRVNGCPDVYDSPASACRVPTARPGQSMHEQGLAIDFNYQGRTICYPRSPAACVGNPAFDWLAANAGRYGLQGLSTEAWHWSTNGE